jgi:fructose-1,6-bisphosphatase/inositol monophosphatase family enzyme
MKKLTHQDADAVSQLMAQVGASEIMPRFIGAVKNDVREKSSAFDVVTDADEAAERALTDRLLRLYPGALVVGEEAAGRDPDLIARIASAELAFIVDPIDGTKNFASRVPLFGTMVAATMHGEVVFAAIHDPVSQDTSLALRGEGAWRNDAQGRAGGLEVASCVPVSDMHGVAGTNFLPEPLRSRMARNLSRVAMSFWMRCAAHEYRMAAAGHCHFLVYNRLMPWDHAAGWLLHREAGGYSAHYDGSAYLPSHTTGGLICAPDRTSWELIREALLEIPPGRADGGGAEIPKDG